MTRQLIIEQTIKIIKQLPEDKAEEISDFANFIIKRYEEQSLTNELQQMVSESEAFNFLNYEEDIYSIKDLKEVYNG